MYYERDVGAPIRQRTATGVGHGPSCPSRARWTGTQGCVTATTGHSQPAHPISIVLEPTSSRPMSISRIGRRPVRIKGCKVLPARTANFWTPRRCVRTWCRPHRSTRFWPSTTVGCSRPELFDDLFPSGRGRPSVPADLAAPGGFAGRAAPTQRPISSSECHSSARWGSRWPRPICWTNTARISPTPVAEGELMP